MLLLIIMTVFSLAGADNSSIGVLGPSTMDGYLLTLMEMVRAQGLTLKELREDFVKGKREAELIREKDKEAAENIRLEDKREAELIRLEDKREAELIRLEDKKGAEAIRLDDWSAHSSNYKLLLSMFEDLSESAVTSKVGDKLDECAKMMGLLLFTPSWKNASVGMLCSAFPLFSAHPLNQSSYFITSAHCFFSMSAVLADTSPKSATIYHLQTPYACSLKHHFFCPPTDPACTGSPSMDLAIVHCPSPLPVASTRLSELPPRHYQSAALLGFSSGNHLDPTYEHHFPSADGLPDFRTALHFKVAHVVPSIQFPSAVDVANITITQLLTLSNNTGASAQVAAQTDSAGYLDIVPEEGMSGGSVVDMKCGLMGVTESRSIFGVGGTYVKLSARVVQRILAAIGGGA